MRLFSASEAIGAQADVGKPAALCTFPDVQRELFLVQRFHGAILALDPGHYERKPLCACRRIASADMPA